MFRIDGKVAVVTGGGNGIGRATALALAGAGAIVVVLDRDGAAANATAAAIQQTGSRASAAAVDVTREAEVETALDAVTRDWGRLDILVTAAGIAIRAPAVELRLADWQSVLDVNLTGVFLSARVAARAMMAAGRGGRIVTVASIMGLSGGGIYPNISYQASKGAIVNLTRALAIEWAPKGILVNAVAPTWVRTRLIEGLLKDPELVRRMEAMTPLGRLAEPEDVAGAIVFLASPAASMITGHVLAVDGGYLAQ